MSYREPSAFNNSSEFDIVRGLRPDYSIVNITGRNADVDAAEDIWDGGGTYTGFPTGSAELVTAVSSSTDDAAAGDGARTVFIEGLDANYVFQSETITLTGTDKADSANTYMRVHKATILTSGSSNQATNVGTITIAHKITTANVFCVMPVGFNKSQVAAYSIPAGKTGYLRHFTCDVAKKNTATMDGTIWIREFNKSPKFDRIFSAGNDDSHHDHIYGGIVLPAKTDVKMRVTVISTTNVEITTSFDLVLIDA